MAAGWTTDEETKALISAWGKANVQEQLDNVKRNKEVYQKIASLLAEQGYVKSWQQCRVKVKNLTQRYAKSEMHIAASILPDDWYEAHYCIHVIITRYAALKPNVPAF